MVSAPIQIFPVTFSGEKATRIQPFSHDFIRWNAHIDYLLPSLTLSRSLFRNCFVFPSAERKGSKGSITNADEIVADTHAASATATVAVATAAVAPSPKVTKMYEENEKTGETTDVSDKSK